MIFRVLGVIKQVVFYLVMGGIVIGVGQTIMDKIKARRNLKEGAVINITMKEGVDYTVQ